MRLMLTPDKLARADPAFHQCAQYEFAIPAVIGREPREADTLREHRLALRRLSQFQSAAGRLDRAITLSAPHIGLTKIAVCLEHVGPKRQRLLDVGNGFRHLALPHQHGAKPAVGFGIGRQYREQLPVAALRVAKRTGVMMHDCLVKQFGMHCGLRRAGWWACRLAATLGPGGPALLAIYRLATVREGSGFASERSRNGQLRGRLATTLTRSRKECSISIAASIDERKPSASAASQDSI